MSPKVIVGPSPLTGMLSSSQKNSSSRSASKSSGTTNLGLKPLDLDTVFEDVPPVQPVHRLEPSPPHTESGVRWDLPDETFTRWWRALPEEDRAEFIGVYGGDEVLARFVCALDYLTVMQARPQSGTTIVEAYAIAVNCPTDSERARSGAVVCWKHDAVQALIDRLRYRSNRQAAARITNRTTAVIEQMLSAAAAEDVEIKDKALAVKSALAFMRMVTDEDIQERVERTKRGFAIARKELSNQQEEIPTEEQARLYVKVLRSQLGEETFERLMLNA